MTLTVDVHHHILPDFFWQATNEQHGPVGGIAPAHWSSEGAISFMDDAKIDVAVTSISTPGVHLGDDTAARTLARRCNEFSAELIQKYPSRFGGFACVSLPDVEGSLREMAYALDVLKLDGVVLFSNARGVYLGDRRFAPLFEELQRRAAVVFIHPTASPGKVDLSTALAAAQKLYGSSYNPELTLKALSYFDDGDLSTLPAKTKDRLAVAAREVDLENLPNIDRIVGGSDPDHGHGS